MGIELHGNSIVDIVTSLDLALSSTTTVAKYLLLYMFRKVVGKSISIEHEHISEWQCLDLSHI